MEFKDKRFRDNRTGEIIKVLDSFENIAILENKEKIDTRKLSNPLYYTEEIDPKNFFSNQSNYNLLAEKIKNIPLDNVRDENGETVLRVQADNPSIRPDDVVDIHVASEEDERAELARKYGVQMDNTDSVKRQNEAFAKMLGDDADELPKVVPIIQHPVSQGSDVIQRVEVNRDGDQVISDIPQTIVIDDPIISLFKKTKRTVDFSISINIDNKIPRLDFVEMMEESYEMSIIDFLADEFTENLLKNPRIIKNMIREKINEMVYDRGKKKPVKKLAPKKITKTEKLEQVIPPKIKPKTRKVKTVSESKESPKSE